MSCYNLGNVKKPVVMQILAVIVEADVYVGMPIVCSVSGEELRSLVKDRQCSKHVWLC